MLCSNGETTPKGTYQRDRANQFFRSYDKSCENTFDVLLIKNYVMELAVQYDMKDLVCTHIRTDWIPLVNKLMRPDGMLQYLDPPDDLKSGEWFNLCNLVSPFDHIGVVVPGEISIHIFYGCWLCTMEPIQEWSLRMEKKWRHLRLNHVQVGISFNSVNSEEARQNFGYFEEIEM